MAELPHFSMGIDDKHGFVAVSSASVPEHLAHWYLACQQFEPVPGEPGLYRLTAPERDGQSRALHAVMSLRSHGYTVSGDLSPAERARARALAQQRSRLARAAVSRSPQRGRAPAPPSTVRPVPPKPAYAPTVHLTAVRGGRTR